MIRRYEDGSIGGSLGPSFSGDVRRWRKGGRGRVRRRTTRIKRAVDRNEPPYGASQAPQVRDFRGFRLGAERHGMHYS